MLYPSVQNGPKMLTKLETKYKAIQWQSWHSWVSVESKVKSSRNSSCKALGGYWKKSYMLKKNPFWQNKYGKKPQRTAESVLMRMWGDRIKVGIRQLLMHSSDKWEAPFWFAATVAGSEAHFLSKEEQEIKLQALYKKKENPTWDTAKDPVHTSCSWSKRHF